MGDKASTIILAIVIKIKITKINELFKKKEGAILMGPSLLENIHPYYYKLLICSYYEYIK